MYWVMRSQNGFKIVLTGDVTAVSNYRNYSYIGFLACIPSNYPKIPWNRKIMEKIFFPTKSGDDGRLTLAPYALRKIEAALLEHGFDENDVAVVDPRKLNNTIGPNTKAIGLTVHDPLGYSAVSQLTSCIFRLIRWQPDPSYTATAFGDLISNPLLTKFNTKLIVGGPGIWQLKEHPEKFQQWGIDCLVDGEAEGIVGSLFDDVVKGKEIPNEVSGMPMRVDEIPLMRKPSTGSIVEITRGCGRGCQFCSPDLLAFRNIPKERILHEVEINVRNGAKLIQLHSEDALFYGRKMGSFDVNHNAIVDLFSSVKKFPGVSEVHTDFFACSTIKSAPQTVKAISEIMELDKKNPGYVETGIETVSPRLVSNIMPGKVKPYAVEQWPDVIDDALGILDDCHWYTVASMMTGLPKETENDVIENLEFIDRIKHHNVFVWVFPLMPLRAMLKNASKWAPEYTPLRAELILKATQHSIRTIYKMAPNIIRLLPSWTRPIAELALRYVTKMADVYLKGTEKSICRGEDRLMLYKDLQMGLNRDGETVMHVSNIVKDLIRIRQQNMIN